ncbi:hypothetical protein D3C87_1997160 [compost metagenome]
MKRVSMSVSVVNSLSSSCLPTNRIEQGPVAVTVAGTIFSLRNSTASPMVCPSLKWAMVTLLPVGWVF